MMQTESGLAFLSRIGTRPILDFGKDLFLSPLNPPEIIEISGMAGAGKSLLCLDLMAWTLLPKMFLGIPLGGMEAEVIFIDCDQHFSILHFTDLMERKIKRFCYNVRLEWKKLGNKKKQEGLMRVNKKTFNEKIENTIKECLKKFIYFNCTNSNQFAVTLLSLEQCLVNKPNVSLIIIDSISSFYWYDRIYKFDSWYKMECYLSNIFHRFFDIVKRNGLVCVCTKQSLFKKRKDTDGQNINIVSNDHSKLEESVAYEFLGKEWTNGVSVKINMILQVRNEEMACNRPDSDNMYCIIETFQGDASKTAHCTFHEDGIRWIKTNAQL